MKRSARSFAAGLAATFISLASDGRADWHADAWPACEAGRTNRYTVGSITNLLAHQVWATNCWDAIAERAGVIFEDGIEELWDQADNYGLGMGDIQGWAYSDFRASHVSYAVRHQTRVLAVEKRLVEVLAGYYWDPLAVATNAVDDWISDGHTITTGLDCTNVSEDVEVVYPDIPWHTPVSLAAAAGAPTNFFEVLPWRWQAGFCDADYPLDAAVLATATNALTAAGGEDYPGGRTYWTMGDYGWDELQAAILALEISPIWLEYLSGYGGDRSDTSTEWWWDGATSNAWANFYAGGGFGGGSSTSSWAAAIADAEIDNADTLDRVVRAYWESAGAYPWPLTNSWFAHYQGAESRLSVTNAAWLAVAGSGVLWEVRETWTDGQVVVSTAQPETATIAGADLSATIFGGDARDDWAGDPNGSGWHGDSPETESICLELSERRVDYPLMLWLIRWDFGFD